MLEYNLNELEEIKVNYHNYDVLREKLIISSRKLLKLSKKVIFSLHKSDNAEISELDDSFKEIMDIKSNNLLLEREAFYSVAMQEYVEAKLFYGLIIESKLYSAKFLKVSDEDYLLGLCDLSGELVRKAVVYSINKDVQKINEFREFLYNIYDFLIDIDVRNGSLRKKIDSVRWAINKFEDLLSG